MNKPGPTAGSRWYTNGLDCKLIAPDQPIPPNFYPGRIYKRRWKNRPWYHRVWKQVRKWVRQ